MYTINAVLSPAGPEITAEVSTIEEMESWITEHRPKFGYWDVEVISPDGKTIR